MTYVDDWNRENSKLNKFYRNQLTSIFDAPHNEFRNRAEFLINAASQQGIFEDMEFVNAGRNGLEVKDLFPGEGRSLRAEVIEWKSGGWICPRIYSPKSRRKSLNYVVSGEIEVIKWDIEKLDADEYILRENMRERYGKGKVRTSGDNEGDQNLAVSIWAVKDSRVLYASSSTKRGNQRFVRIDNEHLPPQEGINYRIKNAEPNWTEKINL